MKANLHNHSLYSDGDETPETVAKLAFDAGIEMVALTDHNTFEGFNRFDKACKGLNIKCIKGVEIDCVQPDIEYQSELLAYFPEGGNEVIDDLLRRKQIERLSRVERALKRAGEYFGRNDLQLSDIKKMAFEERGFEAIMLSNKLMHRYMLAKGIDMPEYAITQPSAWWKSFWSMKDIDTADSLFDTIELISNNNGFAVMPHFGYHCKLDTNNMIVNRDKYIERLRMMIKHGLWGIEMHPYSYLAQAAEINSIIREWANTLGLHITFGSDFHGKRSLHYKFNSMSGDFDGFTR